MLNLKLKKPQGPVALLEVTHLACLRSLSRSRVGLRGPRALGHVFGKRFVVNRYEGTGRSSLGQRTKDGLALLTEAKFKLSNILFTPVGCSQRDVKFI